MTDFFAAVTFVLCEIPNAIKCTLKFPFLWNKSNRIFYLFLSLFLCITSLWEMLNFLFVACRCCLHNERKIIFFFAELFYFSSFYPTPLHWNLKLKYTRKKKWEMIYNLPLHSHKLFNTWIYSRFAKLTPTYTPTPADVYGSFSTSHNCVCGKEEKWKVC